MAIAVGLIERVIGANNPNLKQACDDY